MSRTQLWGAVLLLPLGATAAAQSQPSTTAEEALEAASAAYGPPAPEPECKAAQGEEIVVCAELEEQSQFRIRSDADAENDYARETMNKGDPKAPDVAGPGIFRGEPTIGGLCIPGLQKCPPPPAIIIDFSALPETPPGSDADRVGRGLAPTGNQNGEAAADSEPANPPEPPR